MKRDRAAPERTMVDHSNTGRSIGDLKHVLKLERALARRVSVQLFAARLNPLSKTCADLQARHAALVKLVDGAKAEIERRAHGEGPIIRKA
jgi:hypothetical protein